LRRSTGTASLRRVGLLLAAGGDPGGSSVAARVPKVLCHVFLAILSSRAIFHRAGESGGGVRRNVLFGVTSTMSARPMQSLKQPMIRCRRRSRFPVGSSASRYRGIHQRAAIATRWR